MTEVAKRRPLRLDPVTGKKARDVVAYIERGLPTKHACAMSGMSQDTFYRWRNEAEAGREELQGWLLDVRAAEAKRVMPFWERLRSIALEGDDNVARAACQFLVEVFDAVNRKLTLDDLRRLDSAWRQAVGEQCSSEVAQAIQARAYAIVQGGG